MPAKKLCDVSTYRLLAPVPVPRLSQQHSTALASPKRYDKRYDARFLPQVGRTTRIRLLRRQAMYACVPEIGGGFFAGVCARENRLTFRVTPPPPINQEEGSETVTR